jgi:hypothetical protein
LIAIPLSWFGGPDEKLGELVLPEVVGALCSLSVVPFLRARAAGYVDRLFETLLAWLSRKGAGD